LVESSLTSSIVFISWEQGLGIVTAFTAIAAAGSKEGHGGRGEGGGAIRGGSGNRRNQMDLGFMRDRAMA